MTPCDVIFDKPDILQQKSVMTRPEVPRILFSYNFAHQTMNMFGLAFLLLIAVLFIIVMNSVNFSIYPST